jgi:mannose-6-phosphate isomerase-like protein (cupin superfamily)
MEIVPVTLQPWYEAPDRALAREVVSPRNSRCKTHSIAQIRIPAGIEIREHHHLVTEEVYHVTAGGGRMTLAGESRDLVPGDTVVIRPGEAHKIAASPKVDLEMLVTCVPAWSPEDQILH